MVNIQMPTDIQYMIPVVICRYEMNNGLEFHVSFCVLTARNQSTFPNIRYRYTFDEIVIELHRFWSGLTQQKKAGVLVFACVSI